MKRKIKSHVKVIMLFCVALLMFNCEKEENASNQVESKIQTVTIDEAKNFLTHSKTNSFGKTANNGLENLELDKISQEKINGSDQLLTVIPLATNNSFQNDRILLLKVNNEIKSVVFTMYPDENSKKGSFSGELFSYSLDGKFISGFRAKDGVIVSYFVEDNTAKSTAVTGKAIQLNEVVVQNNYRNLVYALDVFGPTSLFGNNNNMYGGGYNDYNGIEYYSWDAGRGGYDIPQVVLDPCDKIKILMANPNFIVKMEELAKKTSLKVETGYSQSKNGPFASLLALPSTNGADRMQINITSDMVGYVHSHIDDYDSGLVNPDGDPLIRQPIKMFSPADIGIFLQLVKNAQNNNIPIDSVYGAMVSSDGTYQLRFTGDPNQINLNFDWNANSLTNDYTSYLEKGNKEVNFLRFLIDKCYVGGVELYKINKDKTSTKKTLDLNKKIINTNC